MKITGANAAQTAEIERTLSLFPEALHKKVEQKGLLHEIIVLAPGQSFTVSNGDIFSAVFEKHIQGQYNPQTLTITLRNVEAETIAHEYAHVVDAAFGTIRGQYIKDSLTQRIGQYISTLPDEQALANVAPPGYARLSQDASDMLAESVRWYLNLRGENENMFKVPHVNLSEKLRELSPDVYHFIDTVFKTGEPLPFERPTYADDDDDDEDDEYDDSDGE